MSHSKDITIVCLIGACAALALVAWQQRVENRRSVSATASHSKSVDVALTVHTATKHRSLVRPRAVNATGSRALENGEPAFPMIATERATASRPRRTNPLVRLMDDAEFAQALGLQRRAMLDSRFADLFRRLDLDGEELVRFKHLLVEKENVALDFVVVNETAPEPLSDAAIRTGVRAAQAQVEHAIHSSLGSDRYAIYREYERTLAQRATVAQLEQRLSYSPAPLSAAQSEAVVRILVATAPPTPAESVPALSVVVRADTAEVLPILPTSAATGRVTEEAIVQSQSVLSPAQVAALREIQAEQQAAIRATQAMRESGIVEEVPALGLLLLQ